MGKRYFLIADTTNGIMADASFDGYNDLEVVDEDYFVSRLDNLGDDEFIGAEVSEETFNKLDEEYGITKRYGTKEGYQVTVWDSHDNVNHYGPFDTEEKARDFAENEYEINKKERIECSVYVDKGIFEWDDAKEKWSMNADYDWEQICFFDKTTEKEEEDEE